ncbi:MAG: hypothetical protein JZU47_09945 [Prolixibacteraceae bacterium]|nr:hypothetical protein [Prolixibacteraceae bacterium]
MKKSLLIITIILFSDIMVPAQVNKITKEKSVKTPKTEVALPPMKVIPKQNLFILAKRDTNITIHLTRSKLDYFRQNKIDLSLKASELLENYNDLILLDIKPTPSSDLSTSPVEQPIVIAQHILEDGGFETEYADGSKKIQYKSGYTMIFPDGRQMRASYMTVSPFIPPTTPDDENQTRYLQNVSDALLSLLSEFLNNDSVSITNFKKGEAGLNIYQVINRRIEFLNYINQQK